MAAEQKVYRLRVVDDEGAEILHVTSLPEGWHQPGTLPSAPYIAEVPDGDGASLDLLTGKVTKGATTVRVIDADTGGAVVATIETDGFEFPSDAALGAAWPLVNLNPSEGPTGMTRFPAVPEGAGSNQVGILTEFATDSYIERTYSGLVSGAPHRVSFVSRLQVQFNIFGSPTPAVCTVTGTGSASTTVGGSGYNTYSVVAAASPTGTLTIRFSLEAPPGFIGIINWFLDALRIEQVRGDAGRIVTRTLGDADGRYQYLGRTATVDMARLADCVRVGAVGDVPEHWTFPTDPALVTVLQAGAVTKVGIPGGALVWEFTVGDDPKDAREVTVFGRIDQPNGQPWSLPGTPSCIIGGPTLTPWPALGAPATATDSSWRVEVTAASAGLVKCRVLTVRAPQDYRASDAVKDLGERTATLGLANRMAEPFFTPYGTDERPAGTTDADTRGWYPDLRAEMRTATGAAGGTPTGTLVTTCIPLARHVVRSYTLPPSLTIRIDIDRITDGSSLWFRWPDGVTLPSVGAQLDVRVYSLRATAETPILTWAHLADELAAVWTQVGRPYDVTRLTALAAAMPWAIVARRWTEAPSLAAYESDWVGGPFGVALGIDAEGRRSPRPTRVRGATAAAAITTAHLRSADPSIFTQDAGTAIARVRYDWEQYRPWTQQDDTRPADGLVAATLPIVGVPPAEGPYSALPGTDREQAYTLHGFVTNSSGVAVDPVTFADGQAAPLMETFGRGAVVTEIEVLPEGDRQLGDEVVLAIAHRPASDPAYFPASARGIPRTAIVTRRTAHAAGASLELVEVGAASAGAPLTPDPTDATALAAPTLAGVPDPTQPTTHAAVTVTNAAALEALGADVRLEVVIGGATEPAAGTPTLDGGTIATSAGDLSRVIGAYPAGSTVWVRGTTVDPLVPTTSLTGAWVRVDLTAPSTPDPILYRVGYASAEPVYDRTGAQLYARTTV